MMITFALGCILWARRLPSMLPSVSFDHSTKTTLDYRDAVAAYHWINNANMQATRGPFGRRTVGPLRRSNMHWSESRTLHPNHT